MGQLLQEGKFQVRAHDPAAEIPASLRADTLEALVSGADFVGLAVPVPGVKEALERLRPHLRSSQVVFDVGSVKLKPSEAMAEVLGQSVPWVATHPLFGPSSLARNQGPLQVVVCPNAYHPRAVDAVAQLFTQIGCAVVREGPDRHDRVMAETQALAYFVAKGMLGMQREAAPPFFPPSFSALASLLHTVKSEGSHLFTVLERDNPYAAEVRKRLLDSLAEINRSLEDV
jgi:prephenate dehydrogenase